LLFNIYKQQKFTFKLTVEFSYLLIRVEEAKISTIVKFIIHYASTNTRPKAFQNPVVVDNKNDIDNIMKTLSKTDLIEEFTKQREDSKTKIL
jgi:predicted MarR family transcription regulator